MGTPQQPRVLVMGLGGIGGVITTHLLDQGVEALPVTTNAAVRAAVEAEGFILKGEGGALRAQGRVLAAPPEGGPGFDYIFLATQPPQVEAAARTAAPALAEGGRLVVLQNGLCEERVAPIVGRERVIGGIIAWGASTEGPGKFLRTSAGGFTLGRLDGAPDPALDGLKALLSAIGPVAITENLPGARWSKLAINCAVSTLGTVGGQRVGPLLTHAFVRRLGLEVISEAVAVAEAEGVQLVPLGGTVELSRLRLSPGERAGRVSFGLLLKHLAVLAAGARYRKLRSSMLAAIERGRPPAVDFLNGEVVERAKNHGLEAPVNAALRRAVHQIAAGEEQSSLQLLRRIFEETRRR